MKNKYQVLLLIFIVPLSVCNKNYKCLTFKNEEWETGKEKLIFMYTVMSQNF